MRMSNLFAIALMTTGLVTSFARAEAKVGEAAPSFTLQDQEGKTHSLSDFAGKVVVLEWFNDGCPFVRKHYKTGAMNTLAAKYADKGVVWLAINSTNTTTNDRNKKVGTDWKIERPILNDASGQTGKEYGAKTTPEMYVVDKAGKVAYMGAIDDKNDAEAESIKTATNHVAAALDEVLADKPVTVAQTKSYGCSVKYKE